MKKTLFIVTTIFALTIFGCKKERNKTVTVVRDCTGSYLRWEEKDYHVCNLEKITDFANGTEVTATFKKLKKCDGSANDRAVCLMIHQNEGWIEVLEIKE